MAQHYEPTGKQAALHDRDFPHRILDGVWMWSVYSEEKAFYFNGYLIQTADDEAFIVDPPCGGPEVLEAFTPLPKPRLIILTNRDHERASEEFRRRFGIPVWAPEQDAPFLNGTVDRVYQDGEIFPGGWKAMRLEDQKSPGESALYNEQCQWLVLGDALIGNPPERLSMLPDDKYKNKADAVRGLLPLGRLPVKAALACDGDPVLMDARELIADILAS